MRLSVVSTPRARVQRGQSGVTRRFELREGDGKVIAEGIEFPTGIVVVEFPEVPALVTYPSVEVMETKVATSRWTVEWADT
jgi:hypothetical protein